MSLTKRSPEYAEMLREQERRYDPDDELAYQVWADDGGNHFESAEQSAAVLASPAARTWEERLA